MKRAVRILASLALLLVGTGQASAGPIAYGPSATFHLFGSSWDGTIDEGSLEPRVGYPDLAAGPIDVTLHVSNNPIQLSQTSYKAGYYQFPSRGVSLVDGLIQYNATAVVSAGNGLFGLDLRHQSVAVIPPVDAFTHVPYHMPGYSSSLEAVWGDKITASYAGVQPLSSEVQQLLGQGLVIGILYEGSVQVENTSYLSGAASATLTLGATVDTNHIPLVNTVFREFGISTVTGAASYTVPLNQAGEDLYKTGDWSFGVRVDIQNDVHALLGHTIRLGSVTFVDGTTPESRGFTLSFESGIASPNLEPSAVPEPSSLTLLGTGVLGAIGYAWRRKKQPGVAA